MHFSFFSPLFLQFAGYEGKSEAPTITREMERSRTSLGKTFDLAASSVQLFTHPVTLRTSFIPCPSFLYLCNGGNNYRPPIRYVMLINCEEEYKIKVALL